MNMRPTPQALPHNVVINGVRLWYRVAGKHVTGVAPVVFLS
jgi:hypothetical protein